MKLINFTNNTKSLKDSEVENTVKEFLLSDDLYINISNDLTLLCISAYAAKHRLKFDMMVEGVYVFYDFENYFPTGYNDLIESFYVDYCEVVIREGIKIRKERFKHDRSN
jgi:hypothetical protein